MSDRPLRIILCGYGTEGDSRPLIALGAWLNARGDSVLLLLEDDGADRARQAGLRAESLPGDLRENLAAGSGHARVILRLAHKHAGDWARVIRTASEGTDLVVGSGLISMSAQAAAESAGLPYVGVSMFPVVPTRTFPPPLVPFQIPPGFNFQAHVLSQRLSWRVLRRQVDISRRDWGLKPAAFGFAGHPTLCAVSPTLVPRPADWPDYASIIGDLHEPAQQSHLDTKIRDFVEDGPAPVYIGFGSMTMADPGRIRDAVVALSQTRRVLFAPGWSGIELPESANVLTIGNQPHANVLPLVDAVVHHGGAGTIHAAARAGIPQVIVPFAGDQPWWAQRVRDIGVSPPPVRPAKLSGATLARAIEQALHLGARAQHVAHRMSAEDGCRSAAATIDQIVTH